MVVEIFVSRGAGEDSLRDQSALIMDDESGITRIGDRRTEGVEESESVGEFSKEQ